jgi:hypothetical protein
MNKTATHTTISDNTTTKGAYMVYDHSEEEIQTSNMGTSMSAAAIELTTALCLAGLLLAMTLM